MAKSAWCSTSCCIPASSQHLHSIGICFVGDMHPCCPKESHSQKTGLASDLLRSVHQQCPVWPLCYLHSSVNMLRVEFYELRVEYFELSSTGEQCLLSPVDCMRWQLRGGSASFVRRLEACVTLDLCLQSLNKTFHFNLDAICALWNWKWKRSVWNIETQSEHQIETFELKCASISNVLLMSATFVSSNSSAPWCWGTASHHPGGQTDKPYMFETRHTTKFQNIWWETECPWNTCSHLLNCPQIAHSWPCAPGCRKAPRLSTALPPPCRIGSRPCKRAPQAILPVARRKSFFKKRCTTLYNVQWVGFKNGTHFPHLLEQKTKRFRGDSGTQWNSCLWSHQARGPDSLHRVSAMRQGFP